MKAVLNDLERDVFFTFSLHTPFRITSNMRYIFFKVHEKVVDVLVYLKDNASELDRECVDDMCTNTMASLIPGIKEVRYNIRVSTDNYDNLEKFDFCIFGLSEGQIE